MGKERHIRKINYEQHDININLSYFKARYALFLDLLHGVSRS